MTGNNTTFSNTPCMECGMQVIGGEYHPFAACLMFKACHDGNTVRSNLSAVVAFGSPAAPLPDVAGDVEVKRWRIAENSFGTEYEHPEGHLVQYSDYDRVASALRDLRQKMNPRELPEGCPPTCLFGTPYGLRSGRNKPLPSETLLEIHSLGTAAHLSERTEELTKARENLEERDTQLGKMAATLNDTRKCVFRATEILTRQLSEDRMNPDDTGAIVEATTLLEDIPEWPIAALSTKDVRKG